MTNVDYVINSSMAKICTEEEFLKNIEWLTRDPIVKKPFIAIVDNQFDNTKNIIRVDISEIEEKADECKPIFDQIIHHAKSIGFDIFPISPSMEYFSEIVSILNHVRIDHTEGKLKKESYDWYIYYLSYLLKKYSDVNPDTQNVLGENNVCIATIDKDKLIGYEYLCILDMKRQDMN